MVTTSKGARAPRPSASPSTARGWWVLSATSVLGVGLLATSAVSIASAMPLVDTTTQSSVPPITTLSVEEFKGVSAGTGAGVSRENPNTEVRASVATAPEPASAPTVERAPAPAPQPVAPAPRGDSVDSPDSPDSPDSAD